MHPPVSVTVDVGRPRWLAVWMLVCWSVGIFLSALWWWTDGGEATGWRVVLPGLSLLAAGGLLIWQWRHVRPGRLQWDGHEWIWRPTPGNGSGASRGVATAYLELQKIMLLRFTPVQGQAEWLWLESSICAQHWAAIRRAVLGNGGRRAAQNGQLLP